MTKKRTFKSQAQANHYKGQKNQIKSKEFMIRNPYMYGLLTPDRIQIVRAGLGSRDFFSVEYGEAYKKIRPAELAKIDYANPDSLVKLATKVMTTKSEAGFDLISIPIPNDGVFPDFTFLIQVKSNSMPSKPYIEALCEMSFPSYVKKELHIWHDGIKHPQIIKLENK